VATKEQMQDELDRLRIMLGIAFVLIPSSRTRVFFERVDQINKMEKEKNGLSS
jgi:hypothetical protein